MQHTRFCPKEHDIFNIHSVMNSLVYYMGKVFTLVYVFQTLIHVR